MNRTLRAACCEWGRGQVPRIRITAGKVSQTATLNDTKTAALLLENLPVEAAARRWGDEVYFDVPFQTGPEDPQPEVPSGTLAYWPDGPALCVFFGQTPYSPVNVVGKLDGDAGDFAAVESGEPVRVEAVD